MPPTAKHTKTEMETDSQNPYESPQSGAHVEPEKPNRRVRIDPIRAAITLSVLFVLFLIPFEFVKALGTALLFFAIAMSHLFAIPFGWIKANMPRFTSMVILIGGFSFLFGLAIWFFGLLFSLMFSYLFTGIFEIDPQGTAVYTGANLFRLFVSACGGLIIVRNTNIPHVVDNTNH